MTTLVCWCGVDSRGTSSLYIAADSRFSWGTNRTWNNGRKLAVRVGNAEVLAFAGDVTLSQNLLLGLLDGPVTDALLHHRLTALSSEYQLSVLENTAVIFARRLGSGMASSFIVTAHECRAGVWNQLEHAVSTEISDVVCAYGSGGHYATSEVRRWMSHGVSGRTSRSVFSGFCDALRSGRDPRTGGPPQLAGIFRTKPAQEFGIIWDGELSLGGMVPAPETDLDSIEWRNDLFERCDHRSTKRMIGAQPHARPHGLKKI